MRYTLGMLFYGLIFSAPGWAVATTNIGEPAMWAGFGAGLLAYTPFIAAACFPQALEAALAEH